MCKFLCKSFDRDFGLPDQTPQPFTARLKSSSFAKNSSPGPKLSFVVGQTAAMRHPNSDNSESSRAQVTY